MTTAAECAAVAPTVTAHATKSQSAGSIPGHGTQMAQAGQILAGLGAGLPTTSVPSNVATVCSTACTQAAKNAIAAGDFNMAVVLNTAAKIFTNLAAGL